MKRRAKKKLAAGRVRMSGDKIVVEAPLNFMSAGQRSLRMDMVDPKGITSTARFNFDRRLLPDDFETGLYDVDGSVSFTIVVRKK